MTQYWWQVPSSSSGSTSFTYRTDVGLEREIVHREINFELTPDGDGRTLYTRIVPYNTPHQVADPPDFMPYMEEWKPGVFDKQLRAANRVDVLLNFEHEKGIGGVVGRGVQLSSDKDGLHGTFRLLSGGDGDKARELVHEKVLTGMSLEAIVKKSVVGNTGIVARTEAILKNVALCRNPAFPTAEVLAVREEPEEPVPGDPTPGDPDPGEPDGSEAEGQPEGLPAPAASAVIVPELAARSEVDELLERLGYEQIVKRATTNKAWDGSPARFSDDEYERSALICREGDAPPKTRCSLPVLEPNGDLNINAMHAAASRLNQVTGISGALRAAAARRLIRLYRQVGEEPPASIVSIASR